MQPATVASQEEEIVWTQLLLGSVHAMGQVGGYILILKKKLAHQVF